MHEITRQQFVRDVRSAAADGRPYATGKLGTSEKYWMYYEVVVAAEPDPRRRRAYEAALRFHAVQQSGVFPADLAAIRTFNQRFVECVRALDCVGLMRDRLDLEEGIETFYGLDNPWTLFTNQEPDRSIPARDGQCYLPAFEGQRVLIVCPFAELLKARATADIFERVWAKTGKRWFHPAHVDALPFPYGFDAETARRFGTALALHDHLEAEMARRDFDVALIAAGALGIPLAASARKLGRIGISLGGHLQVLFGVLGARWRRPDFQAAYVTDAWIDMPARYQPARTLAEIADGGAYW